MILEILLLVLSIYSISLSYLFFVALRKINQYEVFILDFQRIIEYATEKMKKVDFTGHYKSDDETGFFFEQLKEIQLLLNNMFESEEDKK